MNPYFALESPSSLSGWSPLANLTSPSALRSRVAGTQATLGTGPLRAAASVDFLGIAARVVSPAVGSLVAIGTTPALTLDTVWWQAAVPGPMRLALTAASVSSSLDDAVIEPVLVPLVDAYAATFTLPRKVLWGNVASAVNGAAVTVRADAALATALLSSPRLHDAARSLPPRFVRNSCCLLYRFPDAAMCGDCVLR